VWYVAFSPDGKRVVTAGGEVLGKGEARVWDAATGKALTPPLQHPGRVWRVAFSPDGMRVVTATRGLSFTVQEEARVWDAKTGEEQKKVIISPD
jgi:WD40 repeat protein